MERNIDTDENMRKNIYLFLFLSVASISFFMHFFSKKFLVKRESGFKNRWNVYFFPSLFRWKAYIGVFLSCIFSLEKEVRNITEDRKIIHFFLYLLKGGHLLFSCIFSQKEMDRKKEWHGRYMKYYKFVFFSFFRERYFGSFFP